MKTIGTDISLDCCKAEGYTMIQFDARKKFDRTKEYLIFNYYPEYCEGLNNEIANDTFYSFDELVEKYNLSKEQLQKISDEGLDKVLTDWKRYSNSSYSKDNMGRLTIEKDEFLR